MSNRARSFIVAACCAYPLVAHTAAVLNEPRWAAIGLAVIACAVSSTRLRAWQTALLGVLFFSVAWWLAARFPGWLLYSPPVALNLACCALFAATLGRGREPMVSRFARVERGGELPPDLVRYTRNLTWAWTVFFALMAAISLVLALTGPIALWSLFTNLVNYALVGLFLVLEYWYRRVRFRHYRHASPAEVIRRLGSYRIFPRPADGGWR